MDSKLEVILITLRGLAVDIIIEKETTETVTTDKGKITYPSHTKLKMTQQRGS